MQINKDIWKYIAEMQNDLRVMFNRCYAISRGEICAVCTLRDKCEKLRNKGIHEEGSAV